MIKIIKTYLFCLDEHRNFYEEIRKRFADETKYKIVLSGSHSEFRTTFFEEMAHRGCKVAILTIYEGREQGLLAENLIREIKKAEPATGLVLVYPAEKSEEIKNTLKLNIDAYIPKNDNAILRLHNAIKKAGSEYNLHICRRRRNISLYVLIGFIVLSGLLLFAAYFRFPVYF